jgi:hypothetical protein
MPAELLTQMQSVFEEGFKSQLGKSEIHVEGRIYPSELLLGLGFSRPNQLKQPNFELSINYDPRKDNVLKTVHLLFDAMGALFDHYFQSADDAEFPRYWEEMEFEGRKIFCQYSTANTNIEGAADQLLGLKSESLLQEDEGDREAELREIKMKILGEDEPED